MHIDSSTELVFSFVDEFDNPLTLPAVTLTFFDFDEGFKESERVIEGMCISTAKLDSYQAGSEVQVTSLSTLCDGVSTGSSIRFESTLKGYGCDNPTDPYDLPELSCAECSNCVSNPGIAGNFPIDTAARVVELVFRSVSEVTLTGSIAGNPGTTGGGRSLILAGKSIIANPCTPSPSLPDVPTSGPSIDPSQSPTSTPFSLPMSGGIIGPTMTFPGAKSAKSENIHARLARIATTRKHREHWTLAIFSGGASRWELQEARCATHALFLLRRLDDSRRRPAQKLDLQTRTAS